MQGARVIELLAGWNCGNANVQEWGNSSSGGRKKEE
jgi:hypothetical protein